MHWPLVTGFGRGTGSRSRGSPDVLGKEYVAQDCSLARALEGIGERWTLLILRDAFFGVRRFNDFQAHLDIPKKRFCPTG